MGRSKLTPDKRKGLAGLDPDDSLNMLLKLISDQPRPEIAELFFGDRAKFFILHRWLETSLYEESLEATCAPSLLQTLRAELSTAMLDLANNQTSEFLRLDRRTGPRGMRHAQRLATLAACACFAAANTEAEKLLVTSAWRKLTQRSLVKGQNLKRLLDNLDQADGETAEKRIFLGIHASLTDLKGRELAEQITSVMSHVEQLVS
jgi:hypothetical protein